MIDDQFSGADEFEDPLSNFEPHQYESELARALAEDPVSAIKMLPSLSVTASTPIRDAVELLHRHQISSLLVLDTDREKLVGIFTERDFLERVCERFGKLADDPVAKVMTPEPTVVYDIDPAAASLAAIAIAGHRHVPVLDTGGKPVGIISPLRVFRFLEKHFV